MAISLDLRQRAVDAYLHGNGSLIAVAARFGIGHASLGRWVKRTRETGSPERLPRSGGTPRRVQAAEETMLRAWLRGDVSLTQVELARRLSDATGRAVSQPTICQSLRRMGETLKKS